MTDLSTALRRAASLLGLFALTIAGGWTLSWFAFPLAWLIGSLATSAGLSVAGLQMNVPDIIRKSGQAVAGFAVGLFFTPSVASRVIDLGPLMFGTGAISIAAAMVIARLLARWGVCDRQTAFLSTMPGGMAEMASLAKQFNAETTLVSLAQSLRVVLIVLSIPPIMAIATGTAAIPHQPVPLIAPVPLIIGLAIAIAASVLLATLRLFNPWLIGGLLAGISTALFLGAASKVPQGLTIAAQIAIGTALGARFRRVALIQAARSCFLPATLLSTAGLVCVNVIVAAGISFFIPFLTGVLATSPGGIAEMSLTAEALSLAPPLVAAWQLCRILSVALLTGPLYALYSRLP